MHAVIVAAGMGRRFEPVPLAYPKCLLVFGGKSLLERSIGNLEWAGYNAVTIVAGYCVEMVDTKIKQLKPSIPVDVRFNPDYECGSAVSVLGAADVFENEQTLLLDSDFLYDRRILARINQAPHENVILIDLLQATTWRENWARTRNGRVTGIHLGTRGDVDCVGVYWGFQKFAISAGRQFVSLTRSMVARNPRTEYWDVMARLFDTIAFGYVCIDGLVYCEIDNWQDVKWAQNQIYPQLVALGQG